HTSDARATLALWAPPRMGSTFGVSSTAVGASIRSALTSSSAWRVSSSCVMSLGVLQVKIPISAVHSL
ncbi:unnamed protein product, partial [Closterium sp. NIES-65]